MLACKAQKNPSRVKHVYAFDLSLKSMDPEPFLSIDLDAVSEALGEPVEKFNPSALERHPLTHELYLTATSGQRLLVLSPKGTKVRWSRYLPRWLFPQPEGISFREDGSMFISSEGRAVDQRAQRGATTAVLNQQPQQPPPPPP